MKTGLHVCVGKCVTSINQNHTRCNCREIHAIIPETVVFETIGDKPGDPRILGRSAASQFVSKSSSRKLTWPTSSETISFMLVGYARVSTVDQNLDLQCDALKKSGCDKIFSDVASGALSTRDGLTEALQFLRPGDTLVLWKLDRLGRSLRHLIDAVMELQNKNIGFRSLQESIDTTTSGGKLVFHVFAALAEFERDIIRERTMAGLLAVRARGRKGGRPRKLSEKQIEMATALFKNPQTSVKDICQALNVSKATLYRNVPRNLAPAPSAVKNAPSVE